jgi:hypothetical protein
VNGWRSWEVGHDSSYRGNDHRQHQEQLGGVAYLPITPGGGNLFFQLVNGRYEKGAMILTSNRGFAEWGEIFGEPTLS